MVPAEVYPTDLASFKAYLPSFLRWRGLSRGEGASSMSFWWER